MGELSVVQEVCCFFGVRKGRIDYFQAGSFACNVEKCWTLGFRSTLGGAFLTSATSKLFGGVVVNPEVYESGSTHQNES